MQFSKKAQKCFAIVAGVILGIGFLVYGGREWLNSRRLAAKGKSTTAQVVDVRETVSRKLRRHSYYVTMEFQTENGYSVRRKVEVNKETYGAARNGGSVRAWYLAGDPTTCAAGDKVELRYGNLGFGFVLIFGTVFLTVFFKQPADKEEFVESIEDSLNSLKQTRHEYVPVDARQFRHLDLGFYDGAQRFLQQHGFQYLLDEENISLRSKSFARTFIRVLLSDDGTVVSYVFHCRPGWMLRVLSAKEGKVIDLETWFTNGSWVLTSNAEMAGKLDYPSSIDGLFLPGGTPWLTLWETHQHRVERFREKNPGVQPTMLRDVNDVHRMGDELQRVKAEYRSKAGISKVELERLAGKSGKDVDELHATLAERQVSRAPSWK